MKPFDLTAEVLAVDVLFEVRKSKRALVRAEKLLMAVVRNRRREAKREAERRELVSFERIKDASTS